MNTEMNVFEKLEFIPFDLQNILLRSDNDPRNNFFNTRRFFDMSYFTIGKAKLELSGSVCNSSI